MFARDNNMLPVDAAGELIELPISPTSPLPVKFVSSVPSKFNGGFVQADFLALPWTMVIMRWDGVNSSADRINGFSLAGGTPFFAPLKSSRSRFTRQEPATTSEEAHKGTIAWDEPAPGTLP
jgi:hypothetical protein